MRVSAREVVVVVVVVQVLEAVVFGVYFAGKCS